MHDNIIFHVSAHCKGIWNNIHMYHVDMNKMSNLFRQIVDAFCISVLRVRFLFLIYIYYDDVILQIDPWRVQIFHRVLFLSRFTRLKNLFIFRKVRIDVKFPIIVFSGQNQTVHTIVTRVIWNNWNLAVWSEGPNIKQQFNWIYLKVFT